MATYSLTVEGVERDVLMEGFDIHASLNGPDTLAGDFLSADASFRPALGDEIVFQMDSVRKFAGFVTGVIERGVDGPGGDGGDGIVTEVTAEDYSGQTRRRYITVTIAAGQNIKQALQAVLAATTLTGITLAAGQANGPTLTTAMTFTNERVADVLDAVIVAANELDATGWYWRIDYTGELQAFGPSAVAAPFNLVEGDGTEAGDVRVEDNRSEDYANKVIVDGGTRIEEGHTESFVADGVTDTFQLAYTPLQWWVVVRQSIYYETIGTSPAMWTLDPDAKTITRVAGTPTAGETIDITFTGRLDIVGEAVTGTAAASPPTDVWEKRVAVDGLTSIAEANARAALILASLSASNKLVHYPTYRSGLEPGQTQTITAAKRNLSGSWLIRDVRTIYDAAAGTDGLRYQVTACEGVVKGDFRDTYRQWIEGPQAVTSAEAGGDAVTLGAAGSHTQVQFNNNGAFGADAGFTYVAADDAMTVAGADATITARGKDGGSNFSGGLGNLPAALSIVPENEGIYALAVKYTSDVLTLGMVSGAGAYLNCEGGGLTISETGAGLSLLGTDGIWINPGSPGAAEDRTGLYGLNAIQSFQLYTHRLTTTTYTIDVSLSNLGTAHLFEPTANATITLPALSAVSVYSSSYSRVLVIKNGASSYYVTLDGNSSETIDGALTLCMAPGESVMLLGWNGTSAGWRVIQRHTPPAVTTLTDAAIKALPSGATTLVPAPPTGYRIVLLDCAIQIDGVSGAYTNVNADGYWVLRFGSSDYSDYVANDSGASHTFVTDLLTGADKNSVHLRPLLWKYDANWGAMPIVYGDYYDATALSLFVDNNGAGNYTGGHANNNGVVTVTYRIEAVA